MFAVIDIETTGGSAGRDRITEIAIILHDGHQEEGRFSSLVNPEIPIPAYITGITGITDDMVSDAPRFFEIAKEVVQLTEGRIFVAHNVNFDYGFIREEFRRLGYQFQRKMLCTVRTSRILIPGQPTYSLGRLCESLRIPLRDRHRAMGDAEATAILLERLVSIQPSLAEEKVKKDPFAVFPERISRQILAEMPEDPGVYYFHDAAGQAIHAKAAGNIRSEVMKAFMKSKTDLSDIFEISWEVSASEFMAGLELLASQEKPEVVSKASKRVFVVAYPDQRDYLRLAIVPKASSAEIFGSFVTMEDAKAAIQARVVRHGLCGVLCGTETSSIGNCSRFPAGGCEGACLGQEDAHTYNARLLNAMQGLGFPHSRFMVVDKGRNLEEISVVVMRNGACEYFGYLDGSLAWDDLEVIPQMLKPFPRPESGAEWVRKHLSQIKPHQIRPF